MQKLTKNLILLLLSILIAPFIGVNLSVAQTTSTGNSAVETSQSASEESPVQNLAQGSMAQVTSVSQLSDVQPTDWAFQALQSLVERYGVIAVPPCKTHLPKLANYLQAIAVALAPLVDKLMVLVVEWVELYHYHFHSHFGVQPSESVRQHHYW
jgi:hypothetical protein